MFQGLLSKCYFFFFAVFFFAVFFFVAFFLVFFATLSSPPFYWGTRQENLQTSRSGSRARDSSELPFSSDIAMVLPANKLRLDDFVPLAEQTDIVLEFENSLSIVLLNLNIAYKR